MKVYFLQREEWKKKLRQNVDINAIMVTWEQKVYHRSKTETETWEKSYFQNMFIIDNNNLENVVHMCLVLICSKLLQNISIWFNFPALCLMTLFLIRYKIELRPDKLNEYVIQSIKCMTPWATDLVLIFIRCADISVNFPISYIISVT